MVYHKDPVLALSPLPCISSKLFTIIERHLPDAHAYADHTQLYVSFNANSRDDQSAAEAMQRCIMDIREWMLLDRLKLNDDSGVAKGGRGGATAAPNRKKTIL
jgi:hypothetical protein